MANILVIQDDSLSTEYEKRYVVINKDTGEILDNAQGYGYKTKQKAYAAYAYKNRDKSKDKERKAKVASIRHWMKEHKSFVNDLENICWQIAKGSFGPDEKLNAALINNLFEKHGLTPDFTAAEFLKVYLK